MLWPVLAISGLLLGGLYLAACAYVWANQDALVLPGADLGSPPVSRAGVETVWLTLSDDTRLRGGVACPDPSIGACPELPAVLYFGGNAEDATGILRQLADATGRRAIGYNYRSHAGSEGAASLARLVPDALEVFDQVAAGDWPVAVMGRSIGTGPALAVAAGRPIERLVLVSPYDSVKALAAAAAPWLPMSLLLRHDLVATEPAAGVTAPVSVLLAGADREIPRARSDALIAALRRSPQVFVVPGAGHNDLLTRPEAWSAMRTFFAR